MRNRLHLLSLGTMVMFVACPTPGIAAADKCEPQVAKIVSVQGGIEARRAGEIQWQPAGLNDIYCPGDTIRVRERSRAAIVLINETVLRLDQNTTVTFPEPEEKEISLLDLLTGAIHFFSRVPRTLKVNTPFVNAAVEGTEFFIRVKKDQATLIVFEGEVATSNEQGRLILRSGQSAVAMAGEAPKPRVVARPRDAVQWALYYPPIIDYRTADFRETDWQGMVRRSIGLYGQGDLAGAFASIQEAPEDEITDPRFFTYRAALLLTVGRVDEASADIHKALNLAPNNSHAFALQAIIAVVQNDKDKAFDLAIKAVAFDPESAAAKVALSYAQQANFDLPGALASLQEAVELSPDNALAWARLSELWLSVGDLDKALEAANQAVSLNPNLARTQTVLGFAFLTQIKVEDAKQAFEQAIILDQAAPLPRLGLGLAKIRQSDLEGGRREIEIAVSLDPNNSLIRSYLGKAYYEEKRDKLAASQYAMAKELDPLDPTPWFYDAIRKQSINRPVEALHDLQKSIDLNDNRAVYRSRLLLDGDLAARSASLGRIYSDLGFQQLALVEGWKSVNTDPSNHSAHRFLADSYSSLPRHEIARVSELLQSQLLQPINITPLQPALAESDLLILDGAGPSDPSFNEFNPLFARNRFAFQANGVVGENDTAGDDLVFSGLHGKTSYSIGQFHFETDGFRENNDLEQDIYAAFTQVYLSPRANLQVELRRREEESGDLDLQFDPDDFRPNERTEIRSKSARVGFRYKLNPHDDIIVSAIYNDRDSGLTFRTEDISPGFEFITEFDGTTESEGHSTELQYLRRGQRFNLIVGAGDFDLDRTDVATVTTTLIIPPLDPDIETDIVPTDEDARHTNAYIYYYFINALKNLTATIGVSLDSFEDRTVDRNRSNPKLGLIWQATPSTTLRLAAFKTVKRTLISNQTIEPTQVAGFNQFFDDTNFAETERYGVGLDHVFSPRLYGGVEFSARDIEKPRRETDLDTDTTTAFTEERDELFHRAYLYWTPSDRFAFSAEYLFEKFDRKFSANVQRSLPSEITTHRVPLAINYYQPNGLFIRLKATYVDQDVEFFAGGKTGGSDQFSVVDASVGYRLPKRRGLITVGVKNIFDEEFRFQDTNFQTGEPLIPLFQPERVIFTRFTLSF